MDDNTPADEKMRSEWVAYMITPGEYWDAMDEADAEARWDRWLAAHDARVKAEAQVAILREVATDCNHHPDYAMLWDRAQAIEEASR